MINLKTDKMKYVIKIILIIYLLLIAVFSCGQNNIDNYFNKNQFKEFKHEINGVEIRIDPRIEFFQVMNFIVGNPAINTTEMDYKLSIIQYFEKYRSNVALDYIRNNYNNFFTSIDAPYSFLLSLNDDFTFRKGLVNNKWQK